MKVKEKFDLIYQTGSVVYNQTKSPAKSYRQYVINKEDSIHMFELLKGFARNRNHPLGKFLERKFKECIIIDYPEYPLPAFVSSDGITMINIDSFPSKSITDFSPFDIYSIFLYGISLNEFITNKPFKKEIIPHIEAFLFAVFIKLYGKKAGLTGSYRNLIVKIRFLINLYVESGMYGNELNVGLIRKISSELFFDPSDIKYEYDFSNTTEFLKSIRDNDIIPISENSFSQNIIARGKIISLPMFEDISRLFATLIASTIQGNRLFPTVWGKMIPPVFNKLYTFGINALPKR